MAYCGENKYFSFRDGCCESLPDALLTSASASEFGRVLSSFFGRFSVGCDGFGHNHILYAICCGISEGGKDAYVCENTDLPSFLFGFPLISADCGVYVSGNGKNVKISLFDKKRFPFSSKIMNQIMNSELPKPAKHSGKLISAGSFREIYINNIADSLKNTVSAIPAGISCGSRSVRSLWYEFFTGCSDDLVFQISDDGRKVNAYSSDVGFISYEKLLLTFAHTLAEKGEKVYLPEDFHYGADLISADSGIMRFDPDEAIPDEASVQRFLWDSLYMCTHLASDRQSFFKNIKKSPSLASVRREVVVSESQSVPEKRSVTEKNGRILVSRSGKGRVTLTVQAFESEIASELCGIWADRIRKGDF